MRIQWYGHACFSLVDANGFTILTDPFDETVGYPIPQVTADLVTASHDHHDHNNVQAVRGRPVIIKGPGVHRIPEGELPPSVKVRSVELYHDEVSGRKRGGNTAFIFETDGVRVAHLGDLGHRLSPEKTAEIGSIDVLLVPVGGTYTLDAKGAFDVMGQLAPKIAIPMHYKTDALTFPLATADEFLSLARPSCRRINGSVLEVTGESLEKSQGTEVVVPGYRG